MTKKNIHLLSIPSAVPLYLPLFWASAKTFYERNGKHVDDYTWMLPYPEIIQDIDVIKRKIGSNPPDLFGVSLYVWNYSISLEICAWVKETWPHCVVVVGGPHQYVTHRPDFFKKHTFIDACSPDTAYGEIVIADILDNFNNGDVKWSAVEQAIYPSKSREIIFTSTKRSKAADFDWSYSAYDAQINAIRRYVSILRQYRPYAPLGVKLETTRGCPFQCTYCDWGGTLGTKMAKKPREMIDFDLNILAEESFDLSIIHFCDSNTGIFGERDIITFRNMIEKTAFLGDNKPIVNISGWAKSTVHIKYIKEILMLTANAGLLDALKISIQTFDALSLANVKRTDIAAAEYFELGEYAKSLNCTVIVEMIMGFPGMTLDKFYEEFNQPYERNIEIRMYEWQLLPQSEAYLPEYRARYKIDTAVNNNRSPDSVFNIANETVVETESYSKTDYTHMMTIYALYILFTVGKLYPVSIKNIMKEKNWRMSDFLKAFYKDCYPGIDAVCGTNGAKFKERQIIHTSVKNAMSSGLSTVYSILLLEDFWEEYETQCPVVYNWLLAIGANSDVLNIENIELMANLTDKDVIDNYRMKFMDANKLRIKGSVIKAASLHNLVDVVSTSA